MSEIEGGGISYTSASSSSPQPTTTLLEEVLRMIPRGRCELGDLGRYQCEASPRRLFVFHVDLFFFHAMDSFSRHGSEQLMGVVVMRLSGRRGWPSAPRATPAKMLCFHRRSACYDPTKRTIDGRGEATCASKCELGRLQPPTTTSQSVIKPPPHRVRNCVVLIYFFGSAGGLPGGGGGGGGGGGSRRCSPTTARARRGASSPTAFHGRASLVQGAASVSARRTKPVPATAHHPTTTHPTTTTTAIALSPLGLG